MPWKWPLCGNVLTWPLVLLTLQLLCYVTLAINSQPLANTVTTTHITELASAIAEPPNWPALRQSNKRMDQLSRRISSLQDDETSPTHSPHRTCGAVNYNITAHHRQPDHCEPQIITTAAVLHNLHSEDNNDTLRMIAVLHDTTMAIQKLMSTSKGWLLLPKTFQLLPFLPHNGVTYFTNTHTHTHTHMGMTATERICIKFE